MGEIMLMVYLKGKKIIYIKLIYRGDMVQGGRWRSSAAGRLRGLRVYSR